MGILGQLQLSAGAEDYLILPALRSLAQAAFAKALLSGGSQYHTKLEGLLKQVVDADKNDCVKRLICELNAEDTPTALDWDEILLKKVLPLISKEPTSFLEGILVDGVDYSSPFLHLEVARNVGKQEGRAQCAITYSRCPESLEPKRAINILRRRGISVEIEPLQPPAPIPYDGNSTTEESPSAGTDTCSIIFL